MKIDCNSLFGWFVVDDDDDNGRYLNHDGKWQEDTCGSAGQINIYWYDESSAQRAAGELLPALRSLDNGEKIRLPDSEKVFTIVFEPRSGIYYLLDEQNKIHSDLYKKYLNTKVIKL